MSSSRGGAGGGGGGGGRRAAGGGGGGGPQRNNRRNNSNFRNHNNRHQQQQQGSSSSMSSAAAAALDLDAPWRDTTTGSSSSNTTAGAAAAMMMEVAKATTTGAYNPQTPGGYASEHSSNYSPYQASPAGEGRMGGGSSGGGGSDRGAGGGGSERDVRERGSASERSRDLDPSSPGGYGMMHSVPSPGGYALSPLNYNSPMTPSGRAGGGPGADVYGYSVPTPGAGLDPYSTLGGSSSVASATSSVLHSHSSHHGGGGGGGGSYSNEWQRTGIEVVIRESHPEPGLRRQNGVIRNVLVGTCAVFLVQEERTVNVQSDQLMPVIPKAGDRVKDATDTTARVTHAGRRWWVCQIVAILMIFGGIGVYKWGEMNGKNHTVCLDERGLVFVEISQGERTEKCSWPIKVKHGMCQYNIDWNNTIGQEEVIYALSTKFPEFTNEKKTLVLQFSVKHEQNVDCGGGYIKLFNCEFESEAMHGETPYLVMFGLEVHSLKPLLIYKYKKNQYILNRKVRCKDDVYTRVYTLIIESDQTYQVLIDGDKVQSGSIEEEWNRGVANWDEYDDDVMKFKQIDNPDYEADSEIYRYPHVCGVGFGLWQVKNGTIFDNVLITDDVAVAEERRKTIVEGADAEKKMKEAQDEEDRKKAEADKKADDEAEDSDNEDDDDEL